MTQQITVRNVTEKHDCAGRKYIYITSQSRDETVPSQFELNPRWMFPHEKLLLATVAPEDCVTIENEGFSGNFLVWGKYVQNHSDVGTRDPVCRCGSPLFSDGYHIYCPNVNCPLTFMARLERLAKTNLIAEQYTQCQMMDRYNRPHFVTADYPELYPFSELLQSKTWVADIGTWYGIPPSLSDIIFKKASHHHLSMATFLTQQLFIDFLEYNDRFYESNDPFISGVRYFFGAMDELVNRRDFNSHTQNHLISKFMWSLGVESLTEDVIQKMLEVEMGIGIESEVMINYIFFLSHPRDMVQQLGIHPGLASEISREFLLRRHEMYDIFSTYCTSSVMKDCFGDIKPPLLGVQ